MQIFTYNDIINGKYNDIKECPTLHGIKLSLDKRDLVRVANSDFIFYKLSEVYHFAGLVANGDKAVLAFNSNFNNFILEVKDILGTLSDDSFSSTQENPFYNFTINE